MGRGDIRDLALIRLVHQKTKFLSHESKADVDHQTLSYLALDINLPCSSPFASQTWPERASFTASGGW